VHCIYICTHCVTKSRKEEEGDERKKQAKLKSGREKYL
jgi:hypothetical protein